MLWEARLGDETTQTKKRLPWDLSSLSVHTPHTLTLKTEAVGQDGSEMSPAFLILNSIILYKGGNPLLIAAFPHDRKQIQLSIPKPCVRYSTCIHFIKYLTL